MPGVSGIRAFVQLLRRPSGRAEIEGGCPLLRKRERAEERAPRKECALGAMDEDASLHAMIPGGQ